MRATLRTALPRRAAEQQAAAPGDSRRRRRRSSAWSFTRGERLPFALVERVARSAATGSQGPAIVLEETATTYLDAGFDGRRVHGGLLVMRDTKGG